MEYDERKFAELVLYVAGGLREDRGGGATKLNKALYFSEFAHVRATGRPITGAEYQRLEQGPAPRRLVPVREVLLANGDAALVEEVHLGYVQKRLVPLRQPDLSMFDPEELQLVDQVLEELRGHSAASASALSHDEMGWQMVADNETIPYESAYLRRPVLTDAVRRHAAKLAAER